LSIRALISYVKSPSVKLAPAWVSIVLLSLVSSNNEACIPVDGKCPAGFAMNEDGQCIPRGECPAGYARVNDDETGKCFAESRIFN
jgi:hypothetical protein